MRVNQAVYERAHYTPPVANAIEQIANRRNDRRITKFLALRERKSAWRDRSHTRSMFRFHGTSYNVNMTSLLKEMLRSNA